MALLLLLVLGGPVAAYCVGGVPHVGRVGLAAADVANYHLVANQLLSGVVPYSPTFHGHIPFIYPPGILALIVLPSVAGGHYLLAFAAEMLALVLVGTLGLAALARRYLSDSSGTGWAILALLAATGPLLVLRPDPLIGLLIAMSVLAWRRRHPASAFVLIALAGLLKDYGWVAVVPMLALQLGEARSLGLGLAAQVRRVLVSVLPAVALLVLVGAGFAVWSQGGLVHSQLLNSSRGVELESVAGGILLVASLGHNVTVFRGQLGNMLLGGGGLPAAVAVLPGIGLGLLVMLWAVWGGYQRRLGPATTVAGGVAAALIATPVLSPQYLLALLPCLALAAMELEHRRRGNLLCLGLVLALLTQLEFPYLWLSAVAFRPYALAVLELRNLALLVCLALLILWCRKAPGPVETAAILLADG
ncbi:MAG: hypothetical protein ACRENX_11005 [Candidatus Dormibacteria bacterium]